MLAQQIYVNLPVTDLEKSKAFFTQLGFKFNPEFTNEQGACLILGDNIYSMLLTRPFFKTFVPDREITNPWKTTGAIICYSVPKRSDVDELVKRAVAAGGVAYHEPQDHGFMYGQAFEDLDGHLWEVLSYEQKM